MQTRVSLFFFCLLSIISWATCAQGPNLHRLGLEQTTIVPERFLREYDPITIFFDKTIGPPDGAPLDQPGEIFKIDPPHPGQTHWLDGRTLQFLPTIRWPALSQFNITTLTHNFALSTLMSAPISVTPADGSRNLATFQEMTLAFAAPIPIERLKTMLTFAIKPLPGKQSIAALQLTAKDFVIKQIERTTLTDPVRYQLTLLHPIGLGKQITLHIRLAKAKALDAIVASYTFATKPPFRITGFGCADAMYPIAFTGSSYAIEQALDCGNAKGELFLEFSERLGPVSLEKIKQMVHFEPSVKNLAHTVAGKRLHLNFDAARDSTYQLNLHSTPLSSESQRTLAEFADASVYFYLTSAKPYLQWRRSQGMLERYGPQKFPMTGRGEDMLDLRIYKIDPLDRNFWPFPNTSVVIDENAPPPGPGEEPAFATNPEKHLQLLGSPLVSRMVTLPLQNKTTGLNFGLDLKPLFAKISGFGQPGSYLVGYRRIDRSSARNYIRVQITDLSLSTVEEEAAVSFVVTSLQTGKPLAGAKVVVAGQLKRSNQWQTLIAGVTDATGRYRYEHNHAITGAVVQRIVVTHQQDTLVLNPKQPPPHFLNNHWYGSQENWLSWISKQPHKTKAAAVRKVHIFTERPIYRPEEPVHIKGYLRLHQQGTLKLEPKRPRTLVIEGPGEKRWMVPIHLNERGSFYHEFAEKDLPTGTYNIHLLDNITGTELGFTTFAKESYRIPRFEIKLSGPDKVPLDKPFSLTMTADFYAGGRVVDQPVVWRATQFPYIFQSQQFPGFRFSTSGRFSEESGSRSYGSLVKQEQTDKYGSSTFTINPANEQDARARRYVVEASVRGADEQTVSQTKTIYALPAFVLGLKLDRMVTGNNVILPQLLVLDHRGKPLAGKTLRLRLLQRQWHSYLKETDFSSGPAKYINDVVDVTLLERSIVSTDQPMTQSLPVTTSGVYLVELSAWDQLGRLQTVTVDLFVAGKSAVAWKKPKANVFKIVADKTTYTPGETAQLLLQSPFQQASALIVVEAPKENRYHWVTLNRGQYVFELPIAADMSPRLPVHVMLLRGRLPSKQSPGPVEDERFRPKAMASTTWIKVAPTANKINVELQHAKKTLPGQKLPVTVLLNDLNGQPISGEVTLWLVDRAVLALAKAQPLDPFPSFIEKVRARIRLRDTRNSFIGDLLVEEIAGGDGGDENGEDSGMFKRNTVRKLFKAVPYYNPAINVIAGKAEIIIDLPDNLTDFSIRAVAVTGSQRFGYAKSMISVRLPVIVQSALPRFVRFGDIFNAGGIGRIVEGDGGPGRVALEVDGLQVKGKKYQDLVWVPQQPQKLYFPMQVMRAAAVAGKTENQVTVRMAISRDSDKAGDAFAVNLPIKPSRAIVRMETLTQLQPQAVIALPTPQEPVQPGTLTQSLLLTSEPGILKILMGLDYLAQYPHGCTEQQVSRVLPALALTNLLPSIRQQEYHNLGSLMTATLGYLEHVQKPDGLFGYWPGSQGYVGLTAYVVEFLLIAKTNNYLVPEKLLTSGISALKNALRSDYSQLIDGYAVRERVQALYALAKAGAYDEAYAYELFAAALASDLYTQARILTIFLQHSTASQKQIKQLQEMLWKSLVIKRQDGRQVFHGLQYKTKIWGGLVHTSELKTLAAVTQALYLADPNNPKVRLLIAALIARGDNAGWGSTNATAAALLTLSTVISKPTAAPHQLKLTFADKVVPLNTADNIITRLVTKNIHPGKLVHQSGPAESLPYALLRLNYRPLEIGDRVKQKNQGFVVDRELIVLPADIGTDKSLIDGETNPENGAIGLHHSQKIPVHSGETIDIALGSIVEEHIRLINPSERHFVAVRVPFAAGLEPMNPQLANASALAKPTGKMTQAPDYALYEDDRVTFYYNTLAKGSFDFYFRLKANFTGDFVHPSVLAELMYQQTRYGRSHSTRIRITPQTVTTEQK